MKKQKSLHQFEHCEITFSAKIKGGSWSLGPNGEFIWTSDVPLPHPNRKKVRTTS
ncbi:hypothetical protein QQ020_03200 [Fulvivirgaceae bacterium BMA12]|uniref:Uncharacterized protein n=1 Tax=Agaribacillus aureus TaxID=3051825 RepID=A0ABT8L016_9BACT|nr:hypothetical protein [Fulvivirgaceae bacterium BMA12]